MIKLTISVIVAALLLTGVTMAVPNPVDPGVRLSQLRETETVLTVEEAVDIALDHVGLTRAQINRLETEYDVDWWGPEWEVEFNSGVWEYTLEIHAETGAILKANKDWDNLH